MSSWVIGFLTWENKVADDKKKMNNKGHFNMKYILKLKVVFS